VKTPSSVSGALLVFDREGGQLVIGDPDGIAIVELAGEPRTTRHAIAGVRAVAAFGDQLWIVAHEDQLLRLGRDGRPAGEPLRLPFAGRAQLVAAPCGAPAAVWPSSPHIALIDDFGSLQQTELAEADAVIPFTGRRFVVARGARLALPSGVVAQLPPGSRVLAGAVIADGK
jgi:hypothetical protein